jgi:hypothetical protein
LLQSEFPPVSVAYRVVQRALRDRRRAMVQPVWLAAPPLGGLAALLLRGAFRRKGSRRSKKDEEAARDETGLSFCCERVCTSDQLLKRLGSLAKARRCKPRRSLRTAPSAPCACSAQQLIAARNCGTVNAGADAEHLRDRVRRVLCAPGALTHLCRCCRAPCCGICAACARH